MRTVFILDLVEQPHKSQKQEITMYQRLVEELENLRQRLEIREDARSVILSDVVASSPASSATIAFRGMAQK